MNPAEQFPLVMAEAVREAAKRAKTAEQKLTDIKTLCQSTYEWRTGASDVLVDKILDVIDR